MSTITREWLQQAINDYESVRDELPFGLDDYQGNILSALRIALASLEAEPVAWMRDDADGREYNAHNEFSCGGRGIPLYATPPAPVVPEEKPMPNPISMYAVDAVAAIAEVRGWNACRAAMLHAEPVSNSDELPLDYLQGHKDGLEWAAQQAEANHPQTGDWLYDDPIELARAIRKGPDMPTVQGGNSPVTPDGWISCSERMPAQDDWILIYSKHGEYMAGQVQGEYVELSDGTLSWLGNALFWMLLPEPPQEVK